MARSAPSDRLAVRNHRYAARPRHEAHATFGQVQRSCVLISEGAPSSEIGAGTTRARYSPRCQLKSRIGLALGLLCACIIAIVPILIVPRFVALFDQIGTVLPLITQLFVQGYPLLWIFPLLVLVAWRRVRKAESNLPLMLGLIPMILFIPSMLFALSYPIFHLAGSDS